MFYGIKKGPSIEKHNGPFLVKERRPGKPGRRFDPIVAEIFGPKALRSLYIRPSRNDCPFSRPHRVFNTLSSLKTFNPALAGLTQSITF